METAWTNLKMALFVTEQGGKPRPLWWTGISEIVWDTDTRLACPRCGSVVSRDYETVCRNCGFTTLETTEAMGNALVTFEGMLPRGLALTELSGQTVEVLYKECPIRDTYYEDEVILRLSDCEIVSQKMTDPVITGREIVHEETLTIKVKVKCIAEFISSGGEKHG